MSQSGLDELYGCVLLRVDGTVPQPVDGTVVQLAGGTVVQLTDGTVTQRGYYDPDDVEESYVADPRLRRTPSCDYRRFVCSVDDLQGTSYILRESASCRYIQVSGLAEEDYYGLDS